MANTQIIDVLEQIEFYLNKLGEPFRAKAYKTASTALHNILIKLQQPNS